MMGKDDSLIKLKMQDIEKEVDKLTASISEIKRYLLLDTNFSQGELEQRLADHRLFMSLSPSSRQAPDYTLTDCKQLVFTLKDDNYSQVVIAAFLGISQQTVSRWLIERRCSNG